MGKAIFDPLMNISPENLQTTVTLKYSAHLQFDEIKVQNKRPES